MANLRRPACSGQPDAWPPPAVVRSQLAPWPPGPHRSPPAIRRNRHDV